MHEDIQGIMSEAPGGAAADAEREIVATEGYTLVDGSRLTTDAGMTAHRGAVHPDEYVDPSVLREAAEEAFGFTYEDVSSVYRQGRLAPEQHQLRARIDARLLVLSRSGGNMTALAETLGLSGSAVDRALVRAREAYVAPIVKNPAVTTRCVSFISGELGATPRRRRHSQSPPEWTGTVNLTDDEYAQGFEDRPGNPAYWEHRLGGTPLSGNHVAPAKRVLAFPADWPSDESYRLFVGDRP